MKDYKMSKATSQKSMVKGCGPTEEVAEEITKATKKKKKSLFMKKSEK